MLDVPLLLGHVSILLAFFTRTGAKADSIYPLPAVKAALVLRNVANGRRAGLGLLNFVLLELDANTLLDTSEQPLYVGWSFTRPSSSGGAVCSVPRLPR